MTGKTAGKKNSSIGLWIVAAVVLLLCLFLFYKTQQANREFEEKQQELTEVNRAINEANNKTQEMEEEIRYRSTDEYIEEAARGIGLIDPNETIISPEE